MTHRTIDDMIRSRKILITCGTGGVGKTTLSAAIAMRAATLGKKAVVVTIDPAKRLANALGLQTLSDQPTDLSAEVRKVCPDLKGSISAVVPDTRKTFEAFVRELAPTPAVAAQVMQNPIFQIFAKEFSGTNEYMALERLLALHKKTDYDCIILDTPPSRNTLAFLEAPRLLARFFDEKLIRWLILPTNRIIAGGIKKTLGVLENLTGTGFMTHLFDFAAALFEVKANFSANLEKITHLLESDQVGFLMVTAPTPETAPEVDLFVKRLEEHKLNFDGVILNRTVSYLKPETSTPTDSSYSEASKIILALQVREAAVFDNLMRNPLPLCARLPELARDVHSVEDLFHVAVALNPDPV